MSLHERTLMLGSGKIKQLEEDVINTVAQVAKIQSSINDLQSTIKSQNTLLLKQQELFATLTKSQQSSVKALEQEVTVLTHHNKEFAKEQHNLRTSRIELETKAISSIRQQLGKAVEHIEHELSLDTTKVEQLIADLAQIQKELKTAKVAIATLSDAAQSVKQADLSVRNYAKELEKGDREKLELMKRIDELEKLLASMKRNTPRRH